MKYQLGDKLFSRIDNKSQKGRIVQDIVTNHGAYNSPFYKFAEKTSKTGFSWAPEWLLYTEDEFIQEVKSGTLLDIQLSTNWT